MQSNPSNADRQTAGMRYENILNKRLTKHLIEVKGKYKQNFGTIGKVNAQKKIRTKPYSTLNCFVTIQR